MPLYVYLFLAIVWFDLSCFKFTFFKSGCFMKTDETVGLISQLNKMHTSNAGEASELIDDILLHGASSDRFVNLLSQNSLITTGLKMLHTNEGSMTDKVIASFK
jgi:hypothetical protein